jgi:ParB/RepB/Spo0J family partition protein
MSVTLTASAPTSDRVAAAPAPLLHLPLSAIKLPANYRQSMDKAALADLAASLVATGQLQAVLVRPLLGDEASADFSHELVFGNRRYAAHELAGLATITATEQLLSAEQAEELRLVENVHRENPHPADEALAVAMLLAKGASRAEVAARLGKSPRWVAQRQAVGTLLPEWAEALRQDRLTLVAAEELSRWPHAVQARVLERYPHEQKLGLESVNWAVRDEHHNLSSAPWQLTDPDLVPAAGACYGCPKRSSCVKELFADDAIGKKDLCLDKVCWATKLDAKITQLLAERSTDEQPAIRISHGYYGAEANQALPLSRYEVVNKKKGAIPAVLVDGPHAGHGRYIKPIGEVLTVSMGGQPIFATPNQPSRGEQMKDTRRKKLTKEARKIVLAERMVGMMEAPATEARPFVYGLLVDMISRELMQHQVLQSGVLVGLQAKWNWPTPPEKFGASGLVHWVQEQIRASAPNEDTQRLVFLLMYVTINREVGAEYKDYQTELAQRLAVPALLADLDTATAAQVAKQYDTTTLRRLKQAA